MMNRRQSKELTRVGRQAVAVFLTCLLALAASCVKVEMVPETEEQKTDASEVRGKDYRVSWIERFNRSPVRQQGEMIRYTIDSVSAIYFDYAYRVAQDWRLSEEQSGRVVRAEEMKDLVQESNRSMEPQFEAFKDAVAYGLESLSRSSDMDGNSVALLEQDVSLFSEIREAVFAPTGSPENYEKRMDRLKLNLQGLSQSILDDLQKYR